MRGSGIARNGLALVALMLLTEAVLRFGLGLGDPPLARLNPETEYELVPSAQYRRWGNTIKVNAFGMRNRDHAAIPSATERRILLIGDSVVYGTNALDQHETIAATLESMLSESARFSGCVVLAMPMAASSWGPVNQAAFLAREGTFGAEAAAIVLSAHDLYDVPQTELDILPYRVDGPLTAIGDAYRLVHERIWRPVQIGEPLPPEIRAERSVLALDTIVAQIKGAGIDPVIVYHPTQPERTAEVKASERNKFRDWAEASGLRFVDLGDVIVDQNGYLDTIHPDPTGASRIAGVLRDELASDLQDCSRLDAD